MSTGSIVGADEGIVVADLSPEIGKVVQFQVFPSIEKPDNEMICADLGPDLAAIGIVLKASAFLSVEHCCLQMVVFDDSGPESCVLQAALHLWSYPLVEYCSFKKEKKCKDCFFSVFKNCS